MFPSAAGPVVDGREAKYRNAAIVAQAAAAVAEASGESWDRFVMRASADQAAAGDIDPATGQNGALVRAVSMAWEPLAAGQADSALVALADTLAGVWIDSVVGLEAGSTFAAEDSAANGWAPGGVAARNDHSDDFGQHRALRPMPASC